MKVLVVDDDRVLADVVAFTLRREGYQVILAYDGASAMERWEVDEPDLIILDELFSGLSLAEVASIVPIIEKLKHQGKTIIMIEHRLKELFRIADRVMVLNYGRKIAEGEAVEVMESPAVTEAYRGSEAD